jgi:Alternative complex III, ActD subunit
MVTDGAAQSYGLLARFVTPQALLDAVRQAKARGYRKLDAFTPYPVEAVSEEIEDHKKSKVSLLVLLGGLTGATTGFGFQLWISSVAYPLNVGGRPLNSWPAFIPATFELTILFAAIAAVIGMFALNKLPQPYHPVFNVPSFERATQDRCFLLIEAEDPSFDPRETRAFLESLGPEEVSDVEP